MKDEVEYRKEVGLLKDITVTLAMAGQSKDCSRFLLRNEILRPDGTLCARVTSGRAAGPGRAQAGRAAGGFAQSNEFAAANQ